MAERAVQLGGARASDRPGRAILLVASAVAVLTLQDAVIKLLSERLPVTEILLIRSAIMLPMIVAVAAATGQFKRLGTRRYGAHLLRAVLNFMAFITYFGALRLMPLADTLAIVFSAPIFIVLFSAVFLKEKVGRWRWSAVALGFFGVLVMIRPGASMLDWPVFMALLSSIFYALWMLTTRTMAEDESSLGMLFYSTLFFVLAGAVLAPFEWVPVGGEDLLVLTVLSAISMGGLLMLIHSYRLAQASILAPFDYTAMVWAVLLGWFVWNELPGPWVIAGTALVVIAGLIIVHREARMPHHAVSLRGPTDE